MEQNENAELAANQPSITVYTTDPCARCMKAKDLLRRHDLDFEEVNLAKDPVGREQPGRVHRPDDLPRRS